MYSALSYRFSIPIRAIKGNVYIVHEITTMLSQSKAVDLLALFLYISCKLMLKALI